MLREGGNAVDAAVCAVLASFAVESPLTGFGAGGFMMVHARRARPCCSTSSSPLPGLDGIERAPSWSRSPSTSMPRRCRRSTSGRPPAGCRGRPPGWSRRWSASARCRWPSWSSRASGSPARARRSTPSRHTSSTSSRRSTTRLAGTRELYAPAGRALREGEIFRFPELAEALERFGAEGAEPFYRGEVAAALSDFVVEHGGTLGRGRPRRLPGDRAPSDPDGVPRQRSADQPAAFLGRDPDRLLPRVAGAARGAQRSRAARRRDGRRQRRPRRGFAEALYGEGLEASLLEPGGLDLRPATCSARPPTSRCSTATGCAPASPAPTARARACSCPAPA